MGILMDILKVTVPTQKLDSIDCFQIATTNNSSQVSSKATTLLPFTHLLSKTTRQEVTSSKRSKSLWKSKKWRATVNLWHCRNWRLNLSSYSLKAQRTPVSDRKIWSCSSRTSLLEVDHLSTSSLNILLWGTMLLRTPSSQVGRSTSIWPRPSLMPKTLQVNRSLQQANQCLNLSLKSYQQSS